ncbi:MAG: hypothetical protein Q9227_003861 [Pyrenula ochraceoflavens]
MNPLFNSAQRQSTSLRKDLDAFSSAPPTSSAALQGQISASLASLSRTVDDYASLSKAELNESKKEKAVERIKTFRADIQSYRSEFDALKRERDDAVHTHNRNELLGRRPHRGATPENPYAQASDPAASPFARGPPPTSAPGPGGAGGGLSFNAGPENYSRESHALREQSFFASTNATLDEYLDRGRNVLGDLSQQREMLKGTQRRLYSVANTLGISGDTIRMVERRAKQDKWIFWGGVVVFFGFCWLVIHYLR